VSGKILKADGQNVVFKGDLLGEITVALDSIDSMTSDQPVYVSLSDGRTINGVLRTRADQADIKSSAGAVTVNRSTIQYIRSEAEQNLYERSLHPRWFEQWTGGADLGIALTRGESDITNIASGLTLTRATRNDRTSIKLASLYEHDKTDDIGETIENTIRFGFRYDRNLSKKWFGYGFTDLEHDEPEQLNLRWVTGGGIGYHLIRNERSQLDLLGGLAVDREYFKGFANDRTSPEAQVGQALSHRFNSRVSVKQELIFFPNLSDTGEYRINFDTSLVTDINRWLGWQVTVNDRYVSNPINRGKQNDFLLTTGIRLKFGTPK